MSPGRMLNTDSLDLSRKSDPVTKQGPGPLPGCRGPGLAAGAGRAAPQAAQLHRFCLVEAWSPSEGSQAEARAGRMRGPENCRTEKLGHLDPTFVHPTSIAVSAWQPLSPCRLPQGRSHRLRATGKKEAVL